VAGAGPAAAATGGAYGQWNFDGGSGSVTVPLPGFPPASVTTDSSSSSAPSGASAYLNDGTPFGADGNPVPVTDLGFQSSFNYGQGSPSPPACGGQTGDDQPHWNPGTATLTGNVADTNGASGWFRPTVPIKA
jgi:hypothetical protein